MVDEDRGSAATAADGYGGGVPGSSSSPLGSLLVNFFFVGGILMFVVSVPTVFGAAMKESKTGDVGTGAGAGAGGGKGKKRGSLSDGG